MGRPAPAGGGGPPRQSKDADRPPAATTMTARIKGRRPPMRIDADASPRRSSGPELLFEISSPSVFFRTIGFVMALKSLPFPSAKASSISAGAELSDRPQDLEWQGDDDIIDSVTADWEQNRRGLR